jgi:hypothetical protein
MTLTTLQPLAYAVAYVTFFFGVASTVLRFYCRQYVLKTWGLDDYIAVAILVGLSSFRIVAAPTYFICRYLSLYNKLFCTCSSIGDAGCKDTSLSRPVDFTKRTRRHMDTLSVVQQLQIIKVGFMSIHSRFV